MPSSKVFIKNTYLEKQAKIMGSAFIIILSIILLVAAYRFYGTYVADQISLDDTIKTPAHRLRDNIDYIPAKPPVLLGHHFASIAGAAPIIGPIVASAYGWGPVIIWLLTGTIFIGAVHDFLSLVASCRHDGKSIGKIVEVHIGRTGKLLFLFFCWAALLLVIAVFTIVVAKTFATVPSSATSSVLFILLAILFGLAVYRMKAGIGAATIAGVLILFTCIWAGIRFPVTLSVNTWIFILIGYIFAASVTPVWILLQPRDYLSSFLLYTTIGLSAAGIIVSNPKTELPVFTGFNIDGLGPIFPVMFVTVACGAISGFHSLVASGTTSKQLDRESDAKLIGYGGMLLECLLAVIAIITAAIMTDGDYHLAMKEKGPIAIFSQGVGQFMTAFNIPLEAGVSIAALTVSAFALTSLDTATRLARYTFQEFFQKNEEARVSIFSNRYVSTAVTAALGGALALSGKWKMIWPLFGAANQLLAAVAFLAIFAWMVKSKKRVTFIKIPMILMFAVTFSALVSLISTNLMEGNYLLCCVASLLLALASVLAIQGFRKMNGDGFTQPADCLEAETGN